MPIILQTRDAAYATALGVDLMYDTGEGGCYLPGQPVIVLALADADGSTCCAALSIDDARYLLTELAAALDEYDHPEEAP